MDLETTTQVDTAAPRYSDTENIRSVRSCVNTCGYRSFSLSYSGGTVASPRLACRVSTALVQVKSLEMCQKLKLGFSFSL